MTKQFQRIKSAHAAFVGRKPVCLTAPDAAMSHSKVSPREINIFRALDPSIATLLERSENSDKTVGRRECWAENKARQGVAIYWREMNFRSIDGAHVGVKAVEPAVAD